MPKPKAVIISTPRSVNSPWIDVFETYDEAADIPEEVWDKAFDNPEFVSLEEVTEVKKKRAALIDKYGDHQLGRLILSNTNRISRNASVVGHGLGETLVGIIQPIFEVFFNEHGKDWLIKGPMQISAYDEKKDRWKSISALGGEQIRYKDLSLGSRDGIGINWDASNMSGISEELTLNTVINKLGQHFVPAEGKTDLAARPTLKDMLLDEVGKVDFVGYAKEAKEKMVAMQKEEHRKEVEAKQEAYGTKFGAWG